MILFGTARAAFIVISFGNVRFPPPLLKRHPETTEDEEPWRFSTRRDPVFPSDNDDDVDEVDGEDDTDAH